MKPQVYQASKIATLSSGEFVGITADSPDQPMTLKAFHCQIMLERMEAKSDHSPYRKVPKEVLYQIFQQIQEETKRIVEDRLAYMRNTPALNLLIINPKAGARRRKQTKL